MTLSTSGYTVGANQPLNHARILWAPITGTVTADGTNGALAANDYTYQRWSAGAGQQVWSLAHSAANIDTMFIAAHNLAGKTFRPQIGGASRTNLMLRSQEFDNAAWAKIRASVTANAGIAPDGTMTAEKIVENTDNNSHYINSSYEVSAGLPTASIYLKSAERSQAWVQIIRDGGGGTASASSTVDLGSGSVLSGTATITQVGGGWFRVAISATASGANYALRVGSAAGGSQSYLGDGTSGILAWGAQLENGALTSYIPTTSAAVASDWYDFASWITPDDNGAIAIMANNAGVPWNTTKFRLVLSEGTGVQVGIIRAGVALQMQRPVFGGVRPIGLTRVVETRQQISETGQFLGLTIQRQARQTVMDWQHLEAAWYRSTFEPFSLALPQTPFGLIQNPLRMPESVAWCWTGSTPQPVNMGIRDLMQVSLEITGLLDT